MDIYGNDDTDTHIFFNLYVMILEYLSLCSDGMDVMLSDVTFRKSKMDVDNTMMERKDQRSGSQYFVYLKKLL